MIVLLTCSKSLKRLGINTRLKTRGTAPANPKPMIVRQIQGSDSPSHTVLRAVATETNTPVLELEPLYETIDPESLNTLVTGDAAVRVAFDYQDFTVTVDAERVVLE